MSLLRRVLREPLLHFLAIGAAVFAVFAWLDESVPTEGPDQIVVTPERAEQLAATFQATWRRPPQAAELEALIDDFVAEEVLYREATALGLDQDDTVIRRRLRQKMEFLIDSAASAVPAEEAELQAHLDAYPARFAKGARVAFEQVFLGDVSQTGEIEALLQALDEGVDPLSLGRPTLLPFAMGLAPERGVDSSFGPGFFTALASEPEVRWRGPVRSAYGNHLVRVTNWQPAEAPTLAEARDAVEADWRREQAETARAETLAQLTDRYAISRPEAGAVLSQ